MIIKYTSLLQIPSIMSFTVSSTDGLGGKGVTLTPKSGSYENVSQSPQRMALFDVIKSYHP